MSAHINRVKRELHGLVLKQRTAANEKKKREAMTERTQLDDHIDTAVLLGRTFLAKAKLKATQVVDDLLVDKPDAEVVPFPTPPAGVEHPSRGTGRFVVKIEASKTLIAASRPDAIESAITSLEALGFDCRIIDA